MRQPLLFGEFHLRFDLQFQLILPGELLRQIDPHVDGSAWMVVIGQNRKAWLYPDHYFERLTMESAAELKPSAGDLALDQLEFAMAWRVELDRQGRLLLPEKLVERQGLGREVTLIGVRDHLELWNNSGWDDQREWIIERRA